jgi:hypothetical protein
MRPNGLNDHGPGTVAGLVLVFVGGPGREVYAGHAPLVTQAKGASVPPSTNGRDPATNGRGA